MADTTYTITLNAKQTAALTKLTAQTNAEKKEGAADMTPNDYLQKAATQWAKSWVQQFDEQDATDLKQAINSGNLTTAQLNAMRVAAGLPPAP